MRRHCAEPALAVRPSISPAARTLPKWAFACADEIVLDYRLRALAQPGCTHVELRGDRNLARMCLEPTEFAAIEACPHREQSSFRGIGQASILDPGAFDLLTIDQRHQPAAIVENL